MFISRESTVSDNFGRSLLETLETSEFSVVLLHHAVFDCTSQYHIAAYPPTASDPCGAYNFGGYPSLQRLSTRELVVGNLVFIGLSSI